MNRSLLLHVVERLEGVMHKLPDTIQKPVLREITPLKELFLQQRAPRLLICGSADQRMEEIVATLFAFVPAEDLTSPISRIHRWREVAIGERGTISVLDARGGDESPESAVADELRKCDADVVVFVDELHAGRVKRKLADDNLASCLAYCAANIPVVRVNLNAAKKANGAAAAEPPASNVLATFDFAVETSAASTAFTSLISQQLPNEARVEMIRISGDRTAQHEIARTLTKSASVICGAVGAQPIPLADLPILTTLQLLMVSGIMYVSGRERSLRAATEFVAALGVNVGAGMLLREGARALLKFVPGWGNVACGMIAAGGTFAIGRAATAYFIDGVSIRDARRTYLTSRKRKAQPAFLHERSAPGKQKSHS